MRTGIATLQKEAVDSALKNNWEKAIKLNLQLLERFPNDLDARIRLGRAFIQTKNFSEAEKIFKEVLKSDPINKIAKKNLEIAKSKKTEKSNGNGLSAKHLIKEPGVTVEIRFKLINTKFKISELVSGDKLTLKIKKMSTAVYFEKYFLGEITERIIVKDLNIAKSKKIKLDASFIKSRGDFIAILIKASSAVFKAEKQDIKPYFKKGTIEGEEPELEMEIVEDIEE